MGKLYLVPTPIGNLDDMSFRAVKVLKGVDYILAEDTRTSGNLLKHFGIETPMFAHHQHNEHKSVAGVIQKITEGNTLALISDAGTPGISDPGYLLVRECLENDIEVECLPGPSAFIPALVVSGLPCDRFHFEGFLPHKKGRQTKLKELAEKNCSLVLYESPYRLVKLLEQIIEFMGPQRRVSVSRELTKVYEETIRGTAGEVLTLFLDKKIKGEFVVVIEGKTG
ncbi:MAG: 16S rRNA (cytidine(1402)-2'-O)-methyltransferase [Bacteroidota bacterium]|nr:16S rRNA (cytidine(1402)-2'-O)-methyltransferase [Bacteroidota bacterium]